MKTISVSAEAAIIVLGNEDAEGAFALLTKGLEELANSEDEAAQKEASLKKAKPKKAKPKKASAGPLIEALEGVALARHVGRLSKRTLAACAARNITPAELIARRNRIKREGE